MPKILAIVLALMLMVLGPTQVMAQAQAPISPQARLDDAKGTLDRVETTLTHGELTEAQLQALRGDVDPVGLEMTALAGELAPRIDAAKARLAQLGPKPEANAPPEPADVSAERGAQDKLFNDLDATVKRARVLAVQASQISDGIGARLRAAFAHALFERAPSLLSPSLWQAVLRELPYDYRAVMSETSDFSAAAWRRLDVWERFTLPALLALLVVLYWPVWQLAVRVRSRKVEATPSRLRKAMAALRVAVATAAVPVGAVLALGGLVTLFDLPTQFHRIGLSLSLGVSVVAAMTGLARGLLAPKSPNWRLVPIADFGAKTLYHVVISICCVVAVEKLIEAVNELIGVALPTAIATRGLGALGVAGVLLFEIRKGRRLRAAAKDVVATAEMQHWAAIMRLVAWAIVLVLIGSVLVGYVAFASFVVEQIIAVAGTLALLYILLAVADDGFAAAFRAKGLLGRTLIATLGVRTDTLDQIAILLAGISRIALYLTAILLVLAPWRIESGDLLVTLQAAFFGFSVGDVRISLAAIIIALLLFCVTLGATRALQRWLEIKYLPHTKLDAGLQNSIKTSLGYVGTTVALGLALDACRGRVRAAGHRGGWSLGRDRARAADHHQQFRVGADPALGAGDPGRRPDHGRDRAGLCAADQRPLDRNRDFRSRPRGHAQFEPHHRRGQELGAQRQDRPHQPAFLAARHGRSGGDPHHAGQDR